MINQTNPSIVDISQRDSLQLWDRTFSTLQLHTAQAVDRPNMGTHNIPITLSIKGTIRKSEPK